jgi:hypothetical protein
MISKMNLNFITFAWGATASETRFLPQISVTQPSWLIETRFLGCLGWLLGGRFSLPSASRSRLLALENQGALRLLIVAIIFKIGRI